MKRWYVIYFAVLLALSGCLGTAELPARPADVKIVSEQPVTEIPLAGPANQAKAEISGMAWYKDWLVLLPQYPSVVETSLYAIPKADIVAFLDGELAGPLTPNPSGSMPQVWKIYPIMKGLKPLHLTAKMFILPSKPIRVQKWPAIWSPER